MVRVEDIKKAYPNPIKCPKNRIADEGEYCVGGAVCKFMGRDAQFPGDQMIKEVLKEINPRLNTQFCGLPWARMIVLANDAGNFDVAWSYVEQALKA